MERSVVFSARVVTHLGVSRPAAPPRIARLLDAPTIIGTLVSRGEGSQSARGISCSPAILLKEPPGRATQPGLKVENAVILTASSSPVTMTGDTPLSRPRTRSRPSGVNGCFLVKRTRRACWPFMPELWVGLGGCSQRIPLLGNPQIGRTSQVNLPGSAFSSARPS